MLESRAGCMEFHQERDLSWKELEQEEKECQEGGADPQSWHAQTLMDNCN